jgi:integrase
MPDNVEHLGGDTYRVRLQLPADPVTGRRRQRSKTFHAANQREANKLGRRHRLALEDAAATAVDRATTVAGLADRYEDFKQARWAATTATANHAILGTIRRDLGRIKLADLTAWHVDNWYADLGKRRARRAVGKRTGETVQTDRFLSPRTISHHGRVLNAMLRQGQRWGMVQSRATENATLPSVPDVEMLVPPSEVVRLAVEGATKMFRVALLVAASTGMRRGEVVGLRWSDIEPGVIHVRRAVDDHLNVKEPKSRRGRRRVSVPESVTDAVLAWRAEQRKSALYTGDGGDSFVLADLRRDGSGQRPMRPDWLSQRWAGYRKRLGVPWITLHMLRHWQATELLAAGTPVTTVAQRLGHSDSSVTLRTYAHAVPRLDEVAGGLIGERLALASGGR